MIVDAGALRAVGVRLARLCADVLDARPDRTLIVRAALDALVRLADPFGAVRIFDARDALVLIAAMALLTRRALGALMSDARSINAGPIVAILICAARIDADAVLAAAGRALLVAATLHALTIHAYAGLTVAVLRA